MGKMTDVEDVKKKKAIGYLASIVNDREVSFPAWLL